MSRLNSIRNWGIVLFAGTILLGAAPATADPTPQQLMELIQQQQRAIEKLQKQLEETQAAQVAAGNESKSDGGSDFISENKLKIGGTVEFEATNNESFTADTTSSDLALAKATLYFEAQPHEMLQTYIAGVFNDGTASIDLDEGWVKVGETDDVPAYVKAGSFIVPFGAFNTNMLADPLGLTLAETSEAPVQVG